MGADFAGMARNGRFAVTYSRQKDGGVLSLWDLARREVKARLKVPSGEDCGPFQVSDDGQWVAQASRRETKLYALVWNTPTPEPKKIFFAETSQDTGALAISPDGRFLACKHGDDGLILLDLQESVPRPLIRSDAVMGACFSQDSRFLVYQTHAGLVRLWSVSRHQEVAALAHPKVGGECFGNIQHGRQYFRHSGQGFPFGSHLEAIRLRRKAGPVRARRRNSLRGLQPGWEDTGIGEQGPLGEALGHRHRAAPAHPATF